MTNEQNGQQQNNQNIQLTDEQFQQLLQSQNNNQQSYENQKPSFLKKTKDKTVNALDSGTKGMDGSIFSIARWIISFVKEMIEGLQEYMKLRRASKTQEKNDKGDE